MTKEAAERHSTVVLGFPTEVNGRKLLTVTADGSETVNQ